MQHESSAARSDRANRGWLPYVVGRFCRNKGAVLGLVIVAILAVVALAVPSLITHDPLAIEEPGFKRPSFEHLFGTDDLGRDLYSNVVSGARITLLVGLLCALVSTAIGTSVGAVAGHLGGRADNWLMRFTEIFLVTPRFVLVLVVVAILGPSVWNVILVISVFSWPQTARLVRGQYLSLKEYDFVAAARALGASDLRIMVRHILPNTLAPIVVMASLGVGQAILLESGVSFLGLSDPQAPTWGLMLYNAQQFLGRSLWMAFVPGAAVSLTVLGINLFGEGINDALKPSQGVGL